MCGEQWLCTRSLWSTSGSSPRMRGAVLVVVHGDAAGGIIPARAGSSSRSRPRGTGSWDHPRVCGEQAYLSILYISILGSSPRVRGAAEWVPSYFDFQGIIPARAGSSRGRSATTRPAWDHPRACGEQGETLTDASAAMGSSPRVRGAVRDRYDLDAYNGIIPARAGSSVSPDPSSLEWGDHPRACGEQDELGYKLLAIEGSSPRVRGAVLFCRLNPYFVGIIPARAGSSDPAAVVLVFGRWGSSPRVRGAVIELNGCAGRDHPRACGEQFLHHHTY